MNSFLILGTARDFTSSKTDNSLDTKALANAGSVEILDTAEKAYLKNTEGLASTATGLSAATGLSTATGLLAAGRSVATNFNTLLSQ